MSLFTSSRSFSSSDMSAPSKGIDGCVSDFHRTGKRAGTHTHATTQAAHSSRVARSALGYGLGRFSSLKA